jgi:hypothetical protein
MPQATIPTPRFPLTFTNEIVQEYSYKWPISMVTIRDILVYCRAIELCTLQIGSRAGASPPWEWLLE